MKTVHTQENISRLLRVEDVALRLGLSRQHVYTMAASGEFPSIKLRGAVRFNPVDVDRFIREHRRGKGDEMGVKVREKVQGSGEWWVFIDYKGDRRAKKVGSKRAATELAKEIEKKIGEAEFQIKAPRRSRPSGRTPNSS